jgi:hypothetical protein
MRRLSLLVIAAACLTGAAPSPEPPLADKRLRVETLLREDLFAGVLDDDQDRLARCEKNIEILLEQRPNDKPVLLTVKAGVAMYRAVRAHEAKQNKEFEKKYGQALDLLAQARKLGPANPGVAAITGGMYVMLADRLPESVRGTAWSKAYDSYQDLWKFQAAVVEKLPVHLRGELLGGLAQSSQRTGRTKELSKWLDKIQATAPDSSYARVAGRWKDDPKAAATERITCLTCHAPGRLAATRAALGDK